MWPWWPGSGWIGMAAGRVVDPAAASAAGPPPPAHDGAATVGRAGWQGLITAGAWKRFLSK